MGFLEVITYASVLIFLVMLSTKLLKYARMPMHVRWELYPVPHEGKAWGGSFFEEVDYWTKPRHKDHMAQYKFMVPEILFIRALYEHNRPLWYWSFPFHMGLYLGIGGLVLLGIGAILGLIGASPENSALAEFVQSLTVVVSVTGYIMGAVGSLGLIIKRYGDKTLRETSAGVDFLNLWWLFAIFATSLLVWIGDPGFSISRSYLAGLISFNAKAIPLSTLHIVNLLLFLGFVIYFPFTHMTHMISKYFMWDKVKWDDAPNAADPVMDAKIKEYLAYPVSWSADHVESLGTKSWAEVATSNPWEKSSK